MFRWLGFVGIGLAVSSAGWAAVKGQTVALQWVFSRPAGLEFTKSEITVAQYRACVAAGKCTKPKDKSQIPFCNWGYGDRDAHPVNCVDWHQSKAFCAWAGGRLPTEQEWEKEASDEGRREFPWGNEAPNCKYAVFHHLGSACGRKSTWPVCSKPMGNSLSGLCDMGGNVWEWTSSAHESGKDRKVVRGGSWSDGGPGGLRSANRSWASAPGGASEYSKGFRCVREP